MPPWRHLLAFLVSAAICGVAIWRDMQALAALGLAACFAVLYRRQAKQVFDEALRLLGRAKQAKLGSLEVQIDDKVVNVLERLEQKAEHMHVLLTGLDSDHVGWLLAVHKAGRLEPTPAAKDKLRPLRNRGLLSHDGSSLHEAKQVWLTAIGQELAGLLLAATPELRDAEPKAE